MSNRELNLSLLGTLLLAAPLVMLPLLELLGVGSTMAGTYLKASIAASVLGVVVLIGILFVSYRTRPVNKPC